MGNVRYRKDVIMKLLETRCEPDVEQLLEIIYRRGQPNRVHHIELFLDEEIKDEVCERFDLAEGIDPQESFAKLKRDIKLHAFLGYDAFRFNLIPGGKGIFPLSYLSAEATDDPSMQGIDKRNWTEEHTGPIQSWQDFDRYPWPKVSDIDLTELEWLEKNLPENMGCYDLTAHIIEMLSFLLGYETLCYKIFDEPDLIDAICEKVGNFYVDFTRTLCGFSCMRLIWGSDDMGFRSSTLISPQSLREKILPWHRRCAEIAHEHSRPYLLHCCGNVDTIMDDLIDDVGIDAKHSFEDTIMEVTQAKKKYGNRISLLGGIDVDFLCRSDEKAIRRRVRDTLNVCMPLGGYCLGTGNSVASYIPVENYLIMLDEGRKYTI